MNGHFFFIFLLGIATEMSYWRHYHGACFYKGTGSSPLCYLPFLSRFNKDEWHVETKQSKGQKISHEILSLLSPLKIHNVLAAWHHCIEGTNFRVQTQATPQLFNLYRLIYWRKNSSITYYITDIYLEWTLKNIWILWAHHKIK